MLSRVHPEQLFYFPLISHHQIIQNYLATKNICERPKQTPRPSGFVLTNSVLGPYFFWALVIEPGLFEFSDFQIFDFQVSVL